MENYSIELCANGITLYNHIMEDNTHPYIVATLVVKVGSMYDPKGYGGLSHFLEHMNMSFHDFGLISFAKEYSACAYTNYYETVYVIYGEKSDEAMICDVLCQLIQGEFLLEDKIELVREEILFEYKMVTEFTSHKVAKRLYHDSGYDECIPIGSKEGITSIQIEDLRQFFATWYRPERMSIQFDGCVNLHKVKKRIDELIHFGQPENMESDLKYTSSMKTIATFLSPSEIQNIDTKRCKVSVVNKNEIFVKMVFCYNYTELIQLIKPYTESMLQCMLDMFCDILFFTLSKQLNKGEDDILCDIVDLSEQIVLVSVTIYYNDLAQKKQIVEQLQLQHLERLLLVWVNNSYSHLIEQYQNLINDISFRDALNDVLTKMKYHFLYKRPLHTKEEERLLCKRLLDQLSEETLSVMLIDLLHIGTRGYVETEYVPSTH